MTEANRQRVSAFSASQVLISDWYGTSRLLAAILMRSNSDTGKRSEIAFVDGLRLGSRTRSAVFQST
jgi:hypothetical protein